MHARRTRPDTSALDRRRLAAAFLSAVIPGLGQLFNRRPRLAAVFLIPTGILALIGLLLWVTQSPARLAAMVASPSVLGTLLTLNLVFLVLRIVSVVQAFLDTRWHGPTSRVGILGLLVILGAVVLPHAMVYRYGTAFGATFAKVFDGRREAVAEAPDTKQRINILLLGVDTLPWRTTALTDGLMVVSIDPVGSTVSMVSLPRDLINVPLGNGDVYGPKINSLASYVDSHEDEFEADGLTMLRRAIGTLLGIDIPYYAKLDLLGFVHLVDAVGGIDVTVKEDVEDPEYEIWGEDEPGWSISAGKHHLDGLNALAYARARKGLGESDFTRAGRQQEVLLALRHQVTKDGSLLFKLPELLDLVGDTVTTNIPVERLPELAAIADEIGDDDLTRVVIRHPLVKSKRTRYGSSLDPNVKAIQKVAATLFPAPGVAPQPWPTPKPSVTPKPSATAAP